MTSSSEEVEASSQLGSKPSRNRAGRRREGSQTDPAEIVLTPAEYLVTVALPTLAEFLADLGDARRAYLACMVTAHLVDQVTRSEKVDKPAVRARIASLGGFNCEALEIVEGIYNGTKHAGTGRGEPFPFAPGHEKRRHAFEFDMEGRGLDEADWDIPGLTVVHRGATYFIDECARAVVWGFVAAYPARFVAVDHASVTKPDLDRWGKPVGVDTA